MEAYSSVWFTEFKQTFRLKLKAWSYEFPQLALKYMVMGVPKVVINEKVEFVGAYPEDKFLEQILLATR